MKQMVGGFTILRLSGMIGMVGIKLTKEELLRLNSRLNKIKKRD
jgi:beta-galactosidase